MIYKNSVYKLSAPTVHALLLLPETGMGFQIINALAGRPMSLNKQRETFVVLNASLAMPIAVPPTMNELSGFRRIYQQLDGSMHLATHAQLELSALSIVTDLRSKEAQDCREKVARHGRKIGGKAAVDCRSHNASGAEIYVRLSAFVDDKRIDHAKKCLKPGSFTTTHQDYITCVNSKDSPNDRYALPSNDEIKYSFFIRPKKDDSLQAGTVQPDFGKCGGGEEAYFKNGTSANTLIDRKPYGKFLDPTQTIPGRFDFPSGIRHGLPFGRPYPGGWEPIM